MDQEQVDIVEAERIERALEGSSRLGRPVEPVVELAGDEHVRPLDSRSGHGASDSRLVAVHFGGVDVAVADLQGLTDRCLGIGGRDLEHPEAQLRDQPSVVEGEPGDAAWSVFWSTASVS